MGQNIYIDYMTDYVMHPDHEECKPVTGWTLYQEFSKTTLNRLPVNILDGWVTSRLAFDTSKYPSITPFLLSESLIVDGTIVIFDGEILHRDQYIDAPSNEELLISDPKTGCTLVYTRNLNSWLAQTIKDYGLPSQKVIASETMDIDTIYIYVNGYGILYPHQFTFRRLEQAEESIASQTSEMALSIIVSGYEGVDTKRTREQVRGGARMLFIPGTGVEVFRVGDSNVTNQLLADFQNLLPLYLKALHVPVFEDATNQSGVARQLAMHDAIKYVTETRMHLNNIWKEIGGSELTFGPITLLTAEERTAELDYYERLFNSNYITQDQLMQRIHDILL